MNTLLPCTVHACDCLAAARAIAAALPCCCWPAALCTAARWVWETVRGIDAEPVTPKSLLKSLNACKSFASTSDMADVSRWLHVLSCELAERLAEDEADHSRRARTLGETACGLGMTALSSAAQADAHTRPTWLWHCVHA